MPRCMRWACVCVCVCCICGNAINNSFKAILPGQRCIYISIEFMCFSKMLGRIPGIHSFLTRPFTPLVRSIAPQAKQPIHSFTKKMSFEHSINVSAIYRTRPTAPNTPFSIKFRLQLRLENNRERTTMTRTRSTTIN